MLRKVRVTTILSRLREATANIILLIDQTKEGMRKVTAEEFNDVDGLRRFYANVRSRHLKIVSARC